MNQDIKSIILEQHLKCKECPTNSEVIAFHESVLALLFPQFKRLDIKTEGDVEKHLTKLKTQFINLIQHYPTLCSQNIQNVANQFIGFLPELYAILHADIMAIYDEDPAAENYDEIIRCYPGFYAIATYRIAHKLNQLDIALIPRVLTEHAHTQTGIDIHPGATIGKHFCIDHGTGVVIGETTHIGEYVKIYQGVTLGALSVHKSDANKKRHPTIEDNVVIYANATILGGKTIIGKNSLIGGNVWITESVAPHSKVYYFTNNNEIKKI